MATYIFTPSLDGRINNWDVSWDTARGNTVGESLDKTSDYMYIQTGKSSDPQYGIYRGFLVFNTASLLDNIKIVSAKIRLYRVGGQDEDNDGKDYIAIVSNNQASNTDLILEDYDQLGTTLLSNKLELTGLSSGWVEFTLTTTGIAVISKTGYTKFGIREGHDIENEAYAGANASYNLLSITTSEGTNKPQLIIETPMEDSISGFYEV